MEAKFNHEGTTLTVSLEGRLDTVTSLDLQAKFNDEKITESLVIMDMTNLEYISSAGLRLLLSLKKSLDPKGKALEIHNLNNVCKEVFRVTGFNNVLNCK